MGKKSKKSIIKSTSGPQMWKFKVVCSCGAMNEKHFKYCRVCGTKIDTTSMHDVNNTQNFEYEKCPNCHALTPKQSRKCKFCAICGVQFS
jgi:ribosomal protein L40E